MLNTFFFGGTIDNIEIKYSRTGNTIVNLDIKKKSITQKGEYNALLKCTAFGDLADWISETFEEGDDIFVNGYFGSNEYKGKVYMSLMLSDAMKPYGKKKKKDKPQRKKKPARKRHEEEEEDDVDEIIDDADEYDEEDPPF